MKPVCHVDDTDSLAAAAASGVVARPEVTTTCSATLQRVTQLSSPATAGVASHRHVPLAIRGRTVRQCTRERIRKTFGDHRRSTGIGDESPWQSELAPRGRLELAPTERRRSVIVM